MKRKYTEAAHAKRSLKDAYIFGMTEDEQAEDALAAMNHSEPIYEASTAHHLDDTTLPF